MNKQLLLKSSYFLILYVSLSLLIQQTPLKKALPVFYCAIGNTFNSTFYNGGEISFRNITDEERIGKRKAEYEKYDVLMIFMSQQQKEKAREKARIAGRKTTEITPMQFTINSWNNLGIFIVYFTSLIIVSSVNLKKKTISFSFGLVLIILFISIKNWFSQSVKFAENYPRFQAGIESETGLKIAHQIYLLVNFMGFGLLIVSTIWVLLIGNSLIKKPESL